MIQLLSEEEFDILCTGLSIFQIDCWFARNVLWFLQSKKGFVVTKYQTHFKPPKKLDFRLAPRNVQFGLALALWKTVRGSKQSLQMCIGCKLRLFIAQLLVLDHHRWRTETYRKGNLVEIASIFDLELGAFFKVINFKR